MSGPLSVPNQFQTAVTATGLELDTNFSTVTAYINDPTNRNNYAADGAATNTVVVTFSPPVVGGYTAGLDICWKWGVTNTGGVQVNANGLGLKALVNPDGSALQSGQGPVGSIGRAAYDGTQFIYLTPPSPASKAAMQTATASASFMSPAQAVNHPGVAKAWVTFNGTTTGTQTVTTNGYGVGTIVRTAAGSYSVSLTTTFANVNYAMGWMLSSNFASPSVQTINRDSVGVTIRTSDSSNNPQDFSSVSLTFFGTFA